MYNKINKNLKFLIEMATSLYNLLTKCLHAVLLTGS